MGNQIDEMAKDLCRTDTCEIKKIGIPCNHRCKAHIYAARAIDKGYRKASSVAEDIFAEIDRMIYNLLNDRHYIVGDMCYEVAELKNKYTKESEDAE